MAPIQPTRLGSRPAAWAAEHEAAHGIMRQQQGVAFLQDQLGRATAQRLLAHALLSAGSVHGLFDFPAFVIAQTQLLSGCLLRGEQGGDEAMDLPYLRIEHDEAVGVRAHFLP